ncbi:HIG1 domain family member 2A, mitochondrial [Chironomus tepperi]|uniref:HIG1 domain family member 2A, mitochondrial n=1 Tax=Chironomus tepperi TaxID=113505 RepID=UPI00391F78D4
MTQQEAHSQPELEWIQMKKDFDSERANEETAKEKFIRKFKANPLVPIGCLATAGALSFGLYSFKQGERKMSQMMMRVRILAQGLTVGALVVGVAATFTTDNFNKDTK